MEIQINGKPGSQNRYDDVHISHVGNLYPNAESVNVYNQISVTKSRLSIMLYYAMPFIERIQASCHTRANASRRHAVPSKTPPFPRAGR